MVIKAGGTGDEYVGSYREYTRREEEEEETHTHTEMLAEQGNVEKQKMKE